MTTPLDPEPPGPVELPTPVEPLAPAESSVPVELSAPVEPRVPVELSAPPEPLAAVDAGSTVASHSRLGSRGGRLLLITLTVLGLVGVAGGGTALALELTRGATPAEATAAVQQEIATRWQRLPAAKVFPAQLSYAYIVDSDIWRTKATLVAIAPTVSCQAALEPAAYRLIRKLGCITVLRATYVDADGTAAATVAVAVLPSPAAAQLANSVLSGLKPAAGLHSVAYPGTVTGAYADAARGEFGDQAAIGRYLFLYTAGYTDGMPGAIAATDSAELQYLGIGVVTVVEHTLTAHGNPCQMRDITC